MNKIHDNTSELALTKYITWLRTRLNAVLAYYNKRYTDLDIPMDLTVEDIIDVYNKQSGLCYNSRIPMIYLNNTNFNVESNYLHDIVIQTHDISFGYVKSNIYLVCRSQSKSQLKNYVKERSEKTKSISAKEIHTRAINCKKHEIRSKQHRTNIINQLAAYINSQKNTLMIPSSYNTNTETITLIPNNYNTNIQTNPVISNNYARNYYLNNFKPNQQINNIISCFYNTSISPSTFIYLMDYI